MSKPAKPTAKSTVSKEKKLFAKLLTATGQVQEAGAPLGPGVTHEVVVENGKKTLKRRRFSAI